MPPVPGLGHQQGDHVVLREAEQGAVVAGCVREDGLDSGSAVPLQARCHGAGPGQCTGLRWGESQKPVTDNIPAELILPSVLHVYTPKLSLSTSHPLFSVVLACR